MKKLVCFFAIVLSGANLFSQSISPWVIASSGDFYSGEEISLSWTLGEPVTETFTSNEITLNQGFQQDFSTPFSVEEGTELTGSFIAYPNPVTDYLFISCDQEVGNASVSILNTHSQEVYHDHMDRQSKSFNVSHLSSGLYLLRLSNGHETTTLKIYKY
ncbi:MAG: T9SS type A sorting domain-containing protein [Bacteroidetes bacterium]|nr:T9SS type A sorting domain-containing protein [Bacteroidota bacterium]